MPVHFFASCLLDPFSRHQECGQSAGIFVAHVAVRLGGTGAHRLRIFQPVVNPGGVQARAYLRQRRSDVALVHFGIDDVARLAGILGIEKLLSLLDLGERVSAKGIESLSNAGV